MVTEEGASGQQTGVGRLSRACERERRVGARRRRESLSRIGRRSGPVSCDIFDPVSSGFYSFEGCQNIKLARSRMEIH